VQSVVLIFQINQTHIPSVLHAFNKNNGGSDAVDAKLVIPPFQISQKLMHFVMHAFNKSKGGSVVVDVKIVTAIFQIDRKHIRFVWNATKVDKDADAWNVIMIFRINQRIIICVGPVTGRINKDTLPYNNNPFEDTNGKTTTRTTTMSGITKKVEIENEMQLWFLV
jgi:hypothetical protein